MRFYTPTSDARRLGLFNGAFHPYPALHENRGGLPSYLDSVINPNSANDCEVLHPTARDSGLGKAHFYLIAEFGLNEGPCTWNQNLSLPFWFISADGHRPPRG